MKKMNLFLALFFLLSSLGNAQRMEKNEQKIEAQKIAFISNQLDLTPDEAKVFWPIYNQHDDRVKSIKEKYASNKKLHTLSDQEIEELVNNTLIKESVLLDEKKAYVQNLKKVLPIRKIAILFRSEQQFRRKVLKEVKQRMKRKKKMEKR